MHAFRLAHCQLFWRHFKGLRPRAGAGLSASFSSLPCWGALDSAALERLGLFCAPSLSSDSTGSGSPSRSLVCCAEDFKYQKRFFKTCKHKGIVNILNTFWKAEVYLETCCPVVTGSPAVWPLISTKERKAEKA